MQKDSLAGYRLSPQQESLWLLQQGEENQPYRAQCSILIEGYLESDTLRAALESLVARFEILRTTFHRLPELQFPLQVIADDSPWSLYEYDLRALGAEEQRARVEVLTEEMRLLPFDLENGPLVHFVLLKLSAVEHKLLVTAHALCTDGASLDNLLVELRRLYLSALGESETEDEPMQYADIAEWQNELLMSEEGRVAREYWRNCNPDFAVNQKLPFEKSPHSKSGFSTQSIVLGLAPETTARVKALVKELDSSFPVFLLACWQILLWRLTGREEVVVGLLCDGRAYEELEGALGLLAKYLPVCMQLGEVQSFKNVLERVGEAVNGARKWQEGFVWRADSNAQDKQDARYFASCFAFEAEPHAQDAGTVAFKLESRSVCFHRFKEMLACTLRCDALVTEFRFDASLHSPAAMRLVAERFHKLVESAVDNPCAGIDALEIVNDVEHCRLLTEFNPTETHTEGHKGIVELFETQAERTPDRGAVYFEEHSLTYRQLNERANRLAHYLRKTGIGPNSVVALCLERSTDITVGVLGVLKAGGAYLPLDPALPKERLAFLLKDAAAKALLTQQHLLEKLPGQLPRVLCLDAGGAEVEGESVEGPCNRSSPGDLAYIIYTSGSTGLPKGVAIGHRQIAHYTNAIRQKLGLQDELSFALVSTFAADLGNTVIFPSLCFGGALHVISQDRASDPVALGQYFSQNPIDVLKIVPSHLSALLMTSHPEQVLPRKCLVLGGEATSWELVEKIRQFAPQCAVFNHYGPTETTVGVLVYELGENEDERLSATLPLGRPLAATQVYLLDKFMRPIPVGVSGEVHIGGEGLAGGYVNRPDTTAEKFIPNPFDRHGGARLYKTGDLARYLPGGDVEFIGRADQQVKIRGFRVEPGEIEATLKRNPAVRDARVVAVEHAPGERRLVAYVVPDQARRPVAAQHLRLRSEGYLHERQYHELPNGMGVLHDSKREIEYMYQEIFKERIYLKHGVTLADGDCVFDVGANVGMLSLFVAAQCADPVIYAFEPIPPTFDFLRLNTSLYDLNVKLFNCGLSNKSGEATFTHYPNLSLMSGRFADLEQERAVVKAFERKQVSASSRAGAWDEKLFDDMLTERLTGERFTCQLKTISDVIREHGVEQIDLLKIDVQKSEMEVIEGIHSSDWAKIKQVVLEVHDIDNRVERIKSLLSERGFEVMVEQEEMLENTNRFDLYAVRPEVKRECARRSANRAAAPKPEWMNPQHFVEEVRSFLKDKLPEPMLPAAFVLLNAIPLTPNGKVDHKALPLPEESEAAAKYNYVAPMTPTEETLAQVWGEVLRVERVGIQDNFFALGGDSILAIQIIARANQRGLRLTPKLLFQHQTIAQLATVATCSTAAAQTEQGVVSGALPMTAIQRWFFAQRYANPHHFNQGVLLEVRRALEAAALGEAVGRVVRHHDALRLRFTGAGGEWRQTIVSAEEHEVFSVVRLEDLGAGAGEQAAGFTCEAQRLQRSLHLTGGPLLRVVLFEAGAGQRQRLLIIVHHLAMDGVSWRLLLEDLERAYEQAAAGETVRLPAKTTSFKQWAERIAEYARSAEVRGEMAYWSRQVRRPAALPVDFTGGRNTEGAGRVVTRWLSAEMTRAVLTEVPATYHTQINDVLMTALVRGLSRWTGERGVLLEVEGHGREELCEGVDVTRTVGWFTSMYPVWIGLGESGGGIGEELKRVKEQLRAVPGKGIGYGLLRYMSGDAEVERLLSGGEEAEVSFNYLGQFDQVLGEEGLWQAGTGEVGSVRGEGEQRTRLIDINGSVAGGRLQMSWTYGSEMHERETIERLGEWFVEELDEIVRHCREEGAGGYTPSDFPEANLNQSDLDELVALLTEP